MEVTVRDFDPKKDLKPEQFKAYALGVEHTIKQFNKKITSNWFNDEMVQKEAETAEKYQARLRDLCVELMCSNRGYASCFEK